MSDSDDDMLEYETETAEPTLTGVTVPVQVQGAVTTVPTIAQHVSAWTISLNSSTNPVQELLPYDPLRTKAIIIVNDYPVVICHSQPSAQDPANTASSTPNPDGAYIYASATVSSQIVLTSVQRLWAAATFNQTARVSVIVERRSA